MTHEELTAAGYPVEGEAYDRLARFVEALFEENQKINLTAIREPSVMWKMHVCDALAMAPLMHELQPKRLLDLGAGGGVPGIPLACAAMDLEVTLLDSVRKKMLAARRIVERVGLTNVRTLIGRAETLAHKGEHREKYDVVTARAVGALPVLAEYAAGFVRRGGQCWFEKSIDGLDEEIESARCAAGACGLKFAGVHRFTLPGDCGERVVVIYEKRSLMRKNLPREPGLPKRKPL